MKFFQIPEDCHVSLLSYLEDCDVVALSQTCQTLRQIHLPTLWKTCLLYEEDSYSPDDLKKCPRHTRAVRLSLISTDPAKYPAWVYPQHVQTLIFGRWFSDNKEEASYSILADYLNAEYYPCLKRTNTLYPFHPTSLKAFYNSPQIEISTNVSVELMDQDCEIPSDFFETLRQKCPWFRLTSLILDGTRVSSNFVPLQSDVRYLRRISLTIETEHMFTHLVNQIGLFENLRELEIAIFVYLNYDPNDLNQYDLMVPTWLGLLDQVPDRITSYELAFAEYPSYDSNVSIKSLVNLNNPIVCNKVTSISDHCKFGFLAVVSFLFPYIYFTNLTHVASVIDRMDYVKKLTPDAIIKEYPLVLSQLETLKTLKIDDFVLNTGNVLIFADSLAIFKNLEKVFLSLDFKLTHHSGGFVHDYTGKLFSMIRKNDDIAKPFQDLRTNPQSDVYGEGYDDDIYINGHVFPVLDDPNRKEFRKIAHDFAVTWFENSDIIDGESLRIRKYHKLVNTDEGLIEWRCIAYNYILFKLRQLASLKTLEITCEDHICLPIDQMAKIVRKHTASALDSNSNSNSAATPWPTLEYFILTIKLPQIYRNPDEQRQAVQNLERSLGF